ncbi:MAG: orotidine-5'-phosphate decarboxylase [Rhodospirillales bacterium]|nr:orotidine-5'-phosphate decarboxylase [Rhodospirillales bacterium]
MKPGNPILVALDTPDPQAALRLAKKLAGRVGGVKLGLEFFAANGPDGVRRIAELGLPVFLDLKFHDIPNTVAGALRSVAPLAPLMVNVHAQGGLAMMQAAREAAHEAAAKLGQRPPILLAVTVLTSLDGGALRQAGVAGGAAAQVLRLAKLAKKAGLDGVVCSGLEAKAIRLALGPDFALVVPGIRPLWAAKGDQKRIMTPAKALKVGADWLVIGRPITGAADPADAALRIQAEIDGRR